MWVSFTDLVRESRDVYDVSRDVRALLKELRDKYDYKIQKRSQFYWDYPWAGWLKLEDAEGDTLVLSWNNFDLTLYYQSKEFDEFLTSLKCAEQEESVSKL